MPDVLFVNRHKLMHFGIRHKVWLLANRELQAFSDWMRTTRIEQGFKNQSALAAAMEFDQSVVSRVESGEREPTADFLMALAKAFRLDVQLVASKAGKAADPLDVDEQLRAELLSEFEKLTEEDQLRMIQIAKALRQAQARPAAKKPARA